MRDIYRYYSTVSHQKKQEDFTFHKIWSIVKLSSGEVLCAPEFNFAIEGENRFFHYKLLIYEVHSIIIILVNVSLFPLIEESFLFSSRGP